MPGTIGLISQSGALCTAILDWALPEQGRLLQRRFARADSGDVDFGEVLDYLVSDPKTENIFLYIEGIKNARRFMSALRAAARVKPVLLIKVGRHPAGEKAARSHTGALVGADDVFDAALRRAGVVRLDTIGQMYAAAHGAVLAFPPARQPAGDHHQRRRPRRRWPPTTPRTSASRWRSFPRTTLAQLDEVLPPNWSKSQPDRHHRRRRSRALRRCACRLPRRRRRSMACWPSSRRRR